MYEIIWILLIGAVAGIVHQLMDRVKENDTQAYIRGAIIGAVAGWLISLVFVAQDQNILYIAVFVAGYTGDSIILNVLERYNPISSITDEATTEEKPPES